MLTNIFLIHEFMLWSGPQAVLAAMLNSIDKMSAGYYGMMNLLIQMPVNLYWGIGFAGIMIANFIDESWRAVVNYLRFHFNPKKISLLSGQIKKGGYNQFINFYSTIIIELTLLPPSDSMSGLSGSGIQ